MTRIGKTNRIEYIFLRVKEDSSGCWLWTAAKSQGYGITAYQGRKRSVHTLIYEHLVGPIPDGLELDHLCRVRHCCNPDHLQPVTHAVNIARGALGFELTGLCMAQLHDVSLPNALIVMNGKQTCRKCRNAWKRAKWAKDHPTSIPRGPRND